MKQSSEFRSLDAREKAATEGALASCRAIAERIVEQLSTTRPAQLNIQSLADFCASLERAAEILAQGERVFMRLAQASLPSTLSARRRTRREPKQKHCDG